MNDGPKPDLINSFGEFALAWDFSSPPAVLFLLLTSAYTIGAMRLATRSDKDGRFWYKFTASVLGLVLLATALAGPLDYYSGDLFAAHMSQHIVIAMFAAPLLLLARPMPAYIWALPRPLRVGVGTALTNSGVIIKVMRILTRPSVALPLFIGTLYAWHIPAAYNQSLEDEWLHLFMHFTMFTTAVLFWWPIIGPPPIRTKLTHPQRIVYLLLAVTPTAVLAAIITLSKSVLFDFYLDSPGHFSWSPTEDQRTGGLLMWIPGNFVYLTTVTILFFRWFKEEEQKTSREATLRKRQIRSSDGSTITQDKLKSDVDRTN
ncbi:MAG: cytochrome c oxidase assembly protein [Dehalococcoidia bacterium]|jgi:cytochrome c oxidase assembly factor CtaG|nr:cytochrome c oxidase assembly protein [Dehalococcoidia bacterium]|tara:strand:+ start:1066 stop:2016 length:951 start_codon:yes stop_codon:yes gene_type:complete